MDLYILPTGARMNACQQMRERASQLGMGGLVGLLGQVILQDEATLTLERARERSREASSLPAEALVLDRQIDAHLGTLVRHLESHVRLGDVSPHSSSAEGMLREYVPGGLGSVTRLRIVEQNQRVAHILEGLGGVHAGEVAALGMTALVGKLVALNDELTRALQAERDITSHDELRRSQREAHELFCRAVAWILGHLDPDDAAQGEARARLLEPLDAHQEAEAARRRASAPNPSKGGE
jgi:hypothetical protein